MFRLSLIKAEDLSKSEELRLLKKAKNGSVYARNRLIECNINFLLYLCSKYKPHGHEASELIADAIFGFVQAIDKCDLNRSKSFKRLVFHRVRGAILNSDLYNKTVSVPAHTRWRCHKMKVAETKLFRDKNIVSITSLANVTGHSEHQIQKFKRYEWFLSEMVSLDAQVSEDNDMTYFDTVADESICEYEKVNIMADLDYFLSKLSDNERFIVERRYGIPYHMTMPELSKKLGLSETRMYQIFNEAMRKMKRLAEALQNPNEVQKAINFPHLIMQDS